MSETLPKREVREAPQSKSHAEVMTRKPRWVTAVGIAAAILVVVILAVLHLTGVMGPGAH
jgi:negative regulator of sigma E activity